MRRLGLLAVVLALAGCATGAKPQPPAVDVSGRWMGMWQGHGIDAIPREVEAMAELTQVGARGRGRIILEGTHSADSVPLALRHSGAGGTRVFFDVSGSEISMIHELGAHEFAMDFKVYGDRMVGYVRNADPPVRLVLEREKPRSTAAATRPEPLPPPTPEAQPVTPPPPPPPPVAAAPPPPAPEPAAPEPVQTARPAPREFAPIPEIRTIHFDFDRADIRASDAAILDQNAQWLKGNEMLVLIEGHADERGTNEYNLALGERRAKAAREYLISRGIAADRLTTVSYGEERPVCLERNENCWKRNRRADLLVKPQ